MRGSIHRTYSCFESLSFGSLFFVFVFISLFFAFESFFPFYLFSFEKNSKFYKKMPQLSDFSYASWEDFPPPSCFYGTEMEDPHLHFKFFDSWLLACFGEGVDSDSFHLNCCPLLFM